jgi:cyclase
MDVIEISRGVLAFVRPDQGANVGLIHTADGHVVVDTTSCAADMQELLDAAGVSASEARLVINTHYHGDHTWGNQIFDCPILAHRLCRERMAAKLAEDWSVEAIEASIAAQEAADPAWAREARETVANLRITLPTQVFADDHEMEIGGVRIALLHVGAHTPGSTLVWLPEAAVLFAGDLIFQGRYPYLDDADVPALIDALRRLPELGAQVIVPGHGTLCGAAEIRALVDYLEAAWARIADQVAQGRSVEEAIADPDYPRYGDADVPERREGNVRAIYDQLARSAA